ncbi:MAG: type II restriction enzyme [Kiritimatiellia bacterium]
MKTSIRQAWQNIFDRCGILEAIGKAGYFDITADAIKTIGGKEPRLMAKWDSSALVPEVFSNNGLGLIATARGLYRIGPFNVFHKIESDRLNAAAIQPRQVPAWMRSLSKELRERSEAGLRSSCYASGIIREYAGAQPPEILPGLFGRLTTEKFDFTIRGSGGNRLSISCSGPQFEIDASYESPEALLIVEAKNSLLEDFNIRQLYFPWRYLKEKTNKAVRPLFIMRSNEVISVCEYAFEQAGEMDSITLLSAKRFSFADTVVTTEDLSALLASVRCAQGEEELIFPQADRMDLVIDLCERLRNAPADADDIAEGLNYVPRQGQYYARAANFLGLVEKSQSSYRLTVDGRRIFELPYKSRQLAIAKRFLRYRVFANSLRFWLTHSILPSTDTVVKWLAQDQWSMNATTQKRRASTVLAWTRWLAHLTKQGP